MDDRSLPNRRSIRLRGYDYTQQGAYFVTICVTQRLCLFGEIVTGAMNLSPVGQVADARWQDLPTHTPGLSLDSWVVMPNHLHGVLILPGTASTTPGDCLYRGPASGSLGRIIGGFKSAVSREVAAGNLTLVSPLWQRSYHERIVRNDRELDAIRSYILGNPARWNHDPDHPKLQTLPRPTSPV